MPRQNYGIALSGENKLTKYCTGHFNFTKSMGWLVSTSEGPKAEPNGLLFFCAIQGQGFSSVRTGHDDFRVAFGFVSVDFGNAVKESHESH